MANEGPITKTKLSHIPIAFLAKDINQVLFSHTNAMVITIHIHIWMSPKSSSTMVVKLRSSSYQLSRKWATTESN
jgi:hypothetical protein